MKEGSRDHLDESPATNQKRKTVEYTQREEDDKARGEEKIDKGDQRDESNSDKKHIYECME